MRLGKQNGWAVAVAVIVALAASSVALAAGGGVAGTYTTTIKRPAELKGTWVLTLAKNGGYKVALNGKTLAGGTYSATATTITMREPTGCGGTGTYAWKRSGKTLRFVRKREAPACHIRATILSHPFTKVR